MFPLALYPGLDPNVDPGRRLGELLGPQGRIITQGVEP